jgi:hypothetical protein
MKEFFQALQDAFPVLKNHPIALPRIFFAVLVFVSLYKAKDARQRICKPLLSKLCDKMFATTRWLYVHRDSNVLDNWKYYTSEGRGGKLGDDIVWTLVSWPDLKPEDSFRLVGVVGMVSAFREAEAKLLGRWNIVHDLDHLIGAVPARGLRSKLRHWSAKAVKFLGSL